MGEIDKDARPVLRGVVRDTSDPTGRTMYVLFDRAMSDDEMRDWHDHINTPARILSTIIGNATPAPSDKIAEAARVLLEWWNQDTPENIALDVRKVIRVMNALRENEGDGFEQFDAALRALAGKGE